MAGQSTASVARGCGRKLGQVRVSFDEEQTERGQMEREQSESEQTESEQI